MLTANIEEKAHEFLGLNAYLNRFSQFAYFINDEGELPSFCDLRSCKFDGGLYKQQLEDAVVWTKPVGNGRWRVEVQPRNYQQKKE